MKLSRKLFWAIIATVLIFSNYATVKAEERAIVDYVEINSLELPSYGDSMSKSLISNVTYAPDAKYYIASSMVFIYKNINEEWINVSGNTANYLPVYTEGMYRVSMQVRIDGDNGLLYAFDNEISYSINGSTPANVEPSYIGDTYCYAYVEYYFEIFKETIEFSFPDAYGYDYYDLYVGTPIPQKQLLAIGGSENYTFAKESDNCSWLSVSSQGKISGTPDAACNAQQEIVISCSDGIAATKYITIMIGAVHNPPEQRQAINHVVINNIFIDELAQNIDTGKMVINASYEEDAKYHIAPSMTNIYKQNGNNWQKVGPGTTQQYYLEGNYYASFQVRIDGENGYNYVFGNDVTATINGQQAEREYLTFSDSFSYCYFNYYFTIEKVQISRRNFSLEYDSIDYDGTEHRPTVVHVPATGQSALVFGTEYFVTYPEDCINAGEKVIAITGGGIYQGTTTYTYSINKIDHTIDLNADDVLVRPKKTFQIVADSTGTLSYKSSNTKYATVSKTGLIKGIKPGKATITVTAKGDENHNTTTKKIAVLVPTVLSKATLSKTSYTYTGSNYLPTVKTVNGSSKLKKDIDYTVTYLDGDKNPITSATQAGTYYVSIKGIGKYDGTVNVAYKINKATNPITSSISATTIYVGKTNSLVSASALEAAAISYKITSNSKYAKVIVDDDKYYVQALKAGSATLTITAGETANYKKTTKSIKLKLIKPIDINSSKVTTLGSALYNTTEEVLPSVKVKSGKKTYQKDIDYTVEYQQIDIDGNGIYGEAGDAVKITVSAVDPEKLKLTGQYVKTLTIQQIANPLEITSSSNTVYIGKQDATIATSAKEAAAISYKITKNASYGVIYEDSGTYYVKGKKAGTITITATASATKNYKKTTKTYTMKIAKPVDISSTSITKIANAYWNNGESVQPEVTVKYSKTTYVEGVDYQVTYTQVDLNENGFYGDVGDAVDVIVNADSPTLYRCKGSYSERIIYQKALQIVNTLNVPSSVSVKKTTAAFQVIPEFEEATVESVVGNKYAKVQASSGGYTITGLVKGTATITIKVAETEHYGAATIKLKIKVK